MNFTVAHRIASRKSKFSHCFSLSTSLRKLALVGRGATPKTINFFLNLRIIKKTKKKTAFELQVELEMHQNNLFFFCFPFFLFQKVRL